MIVFFLSLYSSKGSVGTILLASAAIHFYWILNSSGEVSPTESAFIAKFMKSLASHKKQFNPVKKVCIRVDISFIKQRFTCMLILSFSSFTRFEEIQFLLVGQLHLVDQDFSIQFKKGKTYKDSHFGVIPFLKEKDFNPAVVFLLFT